MILHFYVAFDESTLFDIAHTKYRHNSLLQLFRKTVRIIRKPLSFIAQFLNFYVFIDTSTFLKNSSVFFFNSSCFSSEVIFEMFPPRFVGPLNPQKTNTRGNNEDRPRNDTYATNVGDGNGGADRTLGVDDTVQETQHESSGQSSVTQPQYSPLTNIAANNSQGDNMNSTELFREVRDTGEESTASILQIIRNEMREAVAVAVRSALSASPAPSNQASNPSPDVNWPHEFPPENGVKRRQPNNGSCGQPNSRKNSNIQISRPKYHDISKWGIKFDGTSRTPVIEDFIFRVDRLQESYGCSDEELLAGFHNLLEGRANQWYWDRIQRHPDLTFPNLRIDIVREFEQFHSNADVLRQMIDRRQGRDERATQYIDAMNSLRMQLREPLKEHEMVDIIKAGLKPRIAHMIFGTQLYSVEHLRAECRRAESFLEREFQQRSRPGVPVRSVNELYNSDIDELTECVEELRFRNNFQKKPDKTNIKCWNCGTIGHTFKQCSAEQRGYFCFRCGQSGVTTPQCNNCRVGNRRANVNVCGDSRSTQTTE
ncbi:uncharacterized protein LOC142234380 [Haematobia irritans]|uniref:uncharacterized protein LOC142234380 n=1 Tax=Haematobia irritans TaxID=7368 RepID=UPI003F500954